MRRVGPLFASRFDPAPLVELLHQHVEQAPTGLMGDQSAAEFAEHRGIEARIGQLQRERVLPINAPTHRIGGLSVAESFLKLEDCHQRQSPGGCCGLASLGVQVSKQLIGINRS
jgi:hypothetical protein